MSSHNGDRRQARSFSEAELTEARRRLLDARLRGVHTRGRACDHPVRRIDHPHGRAPLSAAQLQLWLVDRMSPHSSAYNELVTVRKSGSFDVDAFRWAFDHVVRRHDAWRTTFETLDGEPVQVVHEHLPSEPALLDLSHLSEGDAETEATSIAIQRTSQPYDLSTGPLIRPLLVRLSRSDHRLYLSMHHLVFDGVSMYRIVLPELVALYDARCAGVQALLPPLPIRYPDYAVWEREWVSSPEVERRIEHFRARLSGAQPLDLPQDRPRPPLKSSAGDVVPISIEPATVRALRELAASANATLFQVLAAAYSYWLQRYSGTRDVVFATACDLRQRPELESMVGYCLTPVVLRCSSEGASTFTDLLREVRHEILDAIGNAVPFEHLVRSLGLPRDPRRNPVFQSAFVLEPPMLTPDPSWSMHQMENAIGAALGKSKFDLSMELDQRSEGHVTGRLIYSTDLFDCGTAQSMTEQYVRLLNRISSTPDVPLTELLEPDTDDRRRQLLHLTRTPHDASTRIDARVMEQARRTPDAVSVVVGTQSLTYRRLAERAQSISALLLDAGVTCGDVVATVLARSIDLVPALLGILMSGAAYVPIDPAQPARRREFMIADSGARVLLTDSSPDHPRAHRGLVVEALVESSRVPDKSSRATEPGDLAYMIYTSGTTGTPKAVRVEHRNVTSLMDSMPEALGTTAADTVLSVASYTFDMSIGDIFPTLGVGAALVVADEEQTKDPRLLIDLVGRSGATFMGATPTTWSALIAAGWSGNPALVAGSVGEPLPEPLADALLARCRAVWNGWGPTETTVFAGGGFVSEGEPITVGKPLTGVRLYVVDERLRLVPTGVPGEILIGGSGVTQGYANRPEESERRFLPDPFCEGHMVFRSGDRGRWLSDGRLQHLGRNDDQVKIRGFRVELGEVESVMAQFPGLDAVAAAAREDRDGRRQLVAYVVGPQPASRGSSSRESVSLEVELRAWMRTRLPDYMVPTAVVHLSALPTSISGKLDRAALPAPAPVMDDTTTRLQRKRIGGGVDPDARTNVAALWSDVLGVDTVDENLNFFDLGGHSLHAAQLLARIESTLGISVTLADFLARGTTLAGLTDLTAQTVASRSRPQQAGSAPPIFVVYPDLASAMSLRHLSSVWKDELPAHPLLPILPGGRYARWHSIEQLAAPLLDAIRSVTPHGPYVLLGYSFGGLLAYELARRLSEDGSHVERVVMLDSPTPEMARQLIRRWKSPAGRLARVREPDRTKMVLDYAANLRWAARERLIEARLVRRAEAEQFDLRGAWDIIQRYSRGGHHVPMELFVTEETATAVGRAALGWKELHRGPLTTHRMPGDHATLLSRPRALEVAELVLQSLRRDYAGST
ncbi:non-ribosomal peptide synthetase [Rhodococcoides yunnanense]|uniref:non-ribosomal peptide synthetase n=1 Tax=Rhodococcoides yunnanense TaxID=278209 RepID=UPI00093265DC|nr:non-ribosomal peptide synthetase [Rhodococcus yunnanensis]